MAVIGLRARVPQLAVGQRVASLALRREGPGAESEGNDRRALDTHQGGTEIGGGGGIDGRGDGGD